MVLLFVKFYISQKNPSSLNFLTKFEHRVMRHFFNEMNSVTSKDIEDILTVSKRTAQRYLANLIKKKLIKKQGTKKDAKYFLNV